MVFFCNTLKNFVNDHTCLHFDQHPDLYLLLYVSGDRHQYQRPGFLVQAWSKLHVPPVTQNSRNLRPGSRHLLWNALGYAKVKYKEPFMACSKHHYRLVHPSKSLQIQSNDSLIIRRINVSDILLICRLCGSYFESSIYRRLIFPIIPALIPISHMAVMTSNFCTGVMGFERYVRFKV